MCCNCTHNSLPTYHREVRETGLGVKGERMDETTRYYTATDVRGEVERGGRKTLFSWYGKLDVGKKKMFSTCVISRTAPVGTGVGVGAEGVEAVSPTTSRAARARNSTTRDIVFAFRAAEEERQGEVIPTVVSFHPKSAGFITVVANWRSG